jgi:hypothetical protein
MTAGGPPSAQPRGPAGAPASKSGQDGAAGAAAAPGSPAPPGGSSRPDAWRLLVAGAVAGAVSRSATAPLDRVKVVLQGHIPGASPASPAHGPSGATILGVVAAIYRERGVMAFWRGNGAVAGTIH